MSEVIENATLEVMDNIEEGMTEEMMAELSGGDEDDDENEGN